MPGLAADYRVIVPDLCGSGRSEAPAEVSRAVFSGWLADFIDAVGGSPASLVANSMGGGVALATSLDHSEHVRALVLVSALGLGKSVGLGFRIVSIPILGELVLPSDARGIRRELLRIAYEDGWFWDGLAEETAGVGSERRIQAVLFQNASVGSQPVRWSPRKSFRNR